MTENLKFDNQMLCPFVSDNIEFISLGNVIDPDKAGIWRGPMVSKNIYQLLYKTNWSNLDFLLIDMPPGTGDVALTLAESCYTTGAIIVTTPSDLAFADNIRTIDMLKKLSISPLAIIENMSFIESGTTLIRPFGNSTAAELAQIACTKNINTLPLQSDIKEHPELLIPLALLLQKSQAI
jgi:ATP-binding protein involved in chromosome partitioning